MTNQKLDIECPKCGSALRVSVEQVFLTKEQAEQVLPTKEQEDGRDARKEGIEKLWAAVDMEKLLKVDKGDFWKNWVPNVRKWFDDMGWLTEAQLEKLKQAVQLSTK